jgi:hypothetical protein
MQYISDRLINAGVIFAHPLHLHLIAETMPRRINPRRFLLSTTFPVLFFLVKVPPIAVALLQNMDDDKEPLIKPG